MNKKQWLCMTLAAVMAMGASFPAYAADEKIDKVKLKFSYDKEPESGDDIGDINVTADGEGYTVESAEYTNADDQDVWVVGDVPKVKVELSAEDGYRFSYTTKSHFTLSGCSADFEKARISDGGDYIEVYAELKRIGGKLEGTEELEWEGTTAYWEEIEGAKSYEVKLMRDERTVTTVETTGNSYNFAGYFNHEGDYAFRVRAIASYNSRVGEWSDDSDSLYIDEEELARYSGSGRWQQNQTGWWYTYDTGGYPASCWKQIDGAWYYFNSAGYMLTGWQKLDGVWYYLMPNGVMATGWHLVNGVWYYMNGSGEMQTGWQDMNGKRYYLNNSGAMLTGWQTLDGRMYYFGSDGAMYANTYTPDGKYVDGSGVMAR